MDIVEPYDVYADVTVELPFEDSSIENITCFHGIEHFSVDHEVKHFLSEVVRVLSPGGQFSLTTPNLGQLARDILEHDYLIYNYRFLLFGTHETPHQAHKYLYTARTLWQLLSAYFEEVDISRSVDDHGGPGLVAICKKPRKA